MHHLLYCIVPNNNNIQATVAQNMSLYDENLEVGPYVCECSCIGSVAAKYVHSTVIAPNIHYVGAATEAVNKWHSDVAKALKAHPMYDEPDPNCSICNGTGKTTSTWNSDGRWDWYQLGGRWTGVLTEGTDSVYKSEADPQNMEPCNQCDKGWKEETCPICKGTGFRLKWPTQWVPCERDILPIAVLLEYFDSKIHTPYALITPDGLWHDRDISDEDWMDYVKRILEENKDNMIVVVDYHS